MPNNDQRMLLEVLLDKIEIELRKNETYLRKIGKFHSIYQYHPYQRLYAWIEELKKIVGQEYDRS